MRRFLPALALVALGFIWFSPPAGTFPTGYTLNYTSTHVGDGAGDTDLLVATLTGDVCDQDLRIALYRPDNSLVTDNGNGAVPGATQIQLTNPGSLTDVPGTYTIGVTCGGVDVGGRTDLEILPEQTTPTTEPPTPTTAPPPPPTVDPTDVVAGSPSFTG
jgi:hypothetical protein